MSQTGNLRPIFRALESPYRRQILVAIAEENLQVDEDRDPLDLAAPEGEPDVLKTKLVHHHLPMLERQGYIEWDRDPHRISKGPSWEEVGPVIELLHEHRDELPDGWL